jgi:hypothetical protein
MKAKAGYTKRDVVVVAGCIVLLLASLGAVGSTGRRRAKEAVCLSNLLQWGRIWKSYADDHNGYFADRDGMLYWPEEIIGYMPSINRKIWFCPEATKTSAWCIRPEGGRNPFAAWDDIMGGNYYKGSYVINFYIAAAAPGSRPNWADFWGTPSVRGAAYGPIMFDGQWKDMEPYPEDEPQPFEDDVWTPGPHNEMRRANLNRHRGAVNGVFLDLSVRKIGLKQLWRLRWHKNWPPDADLPIWPEWMQNFKDY